MALEFDSDILCINEHWLSESEFGNIHFPGFTLASCFTRAVNIHRVSVIFITVMT